MECRKYLKTVDPTCESHQECQWVPGNKKKKTKGICAPRGTVPTTKPKSTKKSSMNKVSGFGPFLKKLPGITYLEYYNNLPGDRKILLLGETHQTTFGCDTCYVKDGCVLISKYINALNSAQSQCVDFFIESNKRKKDKIGGASSVKTKRNYPIEDLETFRQQFSYLEFPEKKTFFPYLRIHDWDLRFLLCGEDSQLNLCQFRKESLAEIWSSSRRDRMPDLRKISHYLQSSPGTLREKTRLFFDYYVTGYDLEKSKAFVDGLIRSANFFPDVEKEITENNKHVEYIRYKVHKSLEKMDPLIKPYFKEKSLLDIYFEAWFEMTLQEMLSHHITDKIKIIIFQLQTILRQVSLMLTDVYLLSRMFSVFKESKDSVSRGCQDQMYPKNIIVYGGQLHTEMVGKVIKKVFHPPNIEAKSSSEVSCIEFEKPIQFF